MHVGVRLDRPPARPTGPHLNRIRVWSTRGRWWYKIERPGWVEEQCPHTFDTPQAAADAGRDRMAQLTDPAAYQRRLLGQSLLAASRRIEQQYPALASLVRNPAPFIRAANVYYEQQYPALTALVRGLHQTDRRMRS